jgi:hypothetical protein
MSGKQRELETRSEINDSRVGSMGERLGAVTEKVEKTHSGVVGLTAKVDGIGKQVDSMEAGQKSIIDALADVKARSYTQPPR